MATKRKENRQFPIDVLFEWEWNEAKDDGNCQIGDYELRVEQMDTNLWWCRAYYNGKEIFWFDYEYQNSRYRAIGLVEGAVLAHSYETGTPL